MTAPRRKRDAYDTACVVLAGLAVFLIVFGIRYWIAGGDMGCFFAGDPALCVAVKGVTG